MSQPDSAALPRLTDRKRQAIVKAAMAEFRRHGFEATSMDRIAMRAEVSKRTVYNHFADKQALFEDILQQLWQRSLRQTDMPYRADQPLREQLLALLRLKLELLQDEDFIDLARVAIAESIHAPERTADILQRIGQQEEGITTWLRAAAKDGRLAVKDAGFVAQQVQGLIKGFAFWPQVSLGQPPLSKAMQKQVAESTVDLVLGRYAAE